MHVLIAGGIGITPMMSMLRTLADRGDKRPVILFYGSKDRESTTFREELEALRSRLDLRWCMCSPSRRRAGPASAGASMPRCSPAICPSPMPSMNTSSAARTR